MEEGFNSVWDWLGLDGKVSPDEIIHQVDLNVSALVNEYIMKEEPTILVHVGRKGSHLLSHYKSRLMEKFLTTQLITLRHQSLVRTRPSLPSKVEKPIILVSDTIHTAKEMVEVLATLKASKTKVGKVFCYLKNLEGLKKLEDLGLIRHEQVVGLFSSSSEVEYMTEARKLHVFFRSRIEPMEPDLTYNQYNIDSSLSPKDFRKILKDPLSTTFGLRTAPKNVIEPGFAKDYGEIIFSIGDLKPFETVVAKTIGSSVNYKLRCLSVDLKIKKNGIATDFTVVPRTEISCESNCTGSFCSSKPKGTCLLENCTYKRHHARKVALSVCPQCIDEMVGEAFLNQLEPILIREFSKEGIQCLQQRAYRPGKTD